LLVDAGKGVSVPSSTLETPSSSSYKLPNNILVDDVSVLEPKGEQLPPQTNPPEAPKSEESGLSEDEIQRDLTLLQKIEKQLEIAFRKVSEFVDSLELKNKLGEVVETCHRELCDVSAKVKSNVLLPLGTIASKQAKDFQLDILKLKAEINRLRQELKRELRNTGLKHQEFKNQGKPYFAPFLSFQRLSTDGKPEEKEKKECETQEETLYPKLNKEDAQKEPGKVEKVEPKPEPQKQEAPKSDIELNEEEISQLIQHFEMLEQSTEVQPEPAPTNKALDDLKVLQDMGFVNRKLNLELLSKFSGDINKVVEELLASINV